MKHSTVVSSGQTMADSMKERLIKKFEDEIQALDRELKLELPKEIKRARELGDLRENAEYAAAKERHRLDAPRRRNDRRQAGLPAGHARGRRCGQRPDLDDLPDRPGVSEQGSRR